MACCRAAKHEVSTHAVQIALPFACAVLTITGAMGDSVNKATRLMLLGVVHRVVVTAIDFDATDAVVLDAALAEAAGFLEHEKLELTSPTNGSRFATNLRFGATGELAVHGAGAHHVKPGDTVDLAAYGWMKAKAASKHTATVVEAAQVP